MAGSPADNAVVVAGKLDLTGKKSKVHRNADENSISHGLCPAFMGTEAVRRNLRTMLLDERVFQCRSVDAKGILVTSPSGQVEILETFFQATPPYSIPDKRSPFAHLRRKIEAEDIRRSQEK